ncbi:MAG: hypothetical protein QM757_28970 [Paludibaculum sp.]
MFAHLGRVCRAPFGLAVMLPWLAAANEPPVPCATELQFDAGRLVSDFAETGSTEEVLRKFVRRLAAGRRIPGVFGFENAGVWQEKVSLAANEDDVPSLIRRLLQQDPHLRLTETGNPNVVNLLASGAGGQGRVILDFKLSKFDIETDAAPGDLVFTLPRFSKELDEYLSRVFAAGGGLPGAGAVITGIGDAKLPHFSIHRKNITVREALNAIAAESYRQYVANSAGIQGLDRTTATNRRSARRAGSSTMCRRPEWATSSGSGRSSGRCSSGPLGRERESPADALLQWALNEASRIWCVGATAAVPAIYFEIVP